MSLSTTVDVEIAAALEGSVDLEIAVSVESTVSFESARTRKWFAISTDNRMAGSTGKSWNTR